MLWDIVSSRHVMAKLADAIGCPNFEDKQSAREKEPFQQSFFFLASGFCIID